MKDVETVLTYNDLKNKVSHIYTDNESLELIYKAYNFANEKHNGVKRKTGEDYINHPLNVAYILADLNVDATTIVAALLHEVLTCPNTTIEEIKSTFSNEIVKLCKNLNKINKMNMPSDNETSALIFRKVLVGLAEDVRVLFIRLADRLHNMRSLYTLKPQKQKTTVYETMEVLIPIAHRLGINSIKSELEDLCLKYSRPDIYNEILDKLSTDKDEMNSLLTEMQNNISDILKENNINFEIKGRVKSVYSIYKKLSAGRSFNDIYDILALRIFVEKESDCYLAISLIHAKYRAIPKRFKDYIAMPKANMYQSLHTSIFGIDGQLFEIQVRTYEMDEIAEKGIASHWSYKEKGSKKAQVIMEQKLEMFRNLIESNKDNTSDIDFMKNLNTEFLSDSIYVYTPKGDVIELPKGATPIDFAFRIHSNIGETTVGAIVNDKIVTLDNELKDGDIVNIKTSATAKPNKDWLEFIKTSQARNKIKAYFSKKDRTDYIKKGEGLLDKELKKKKITKDTIINDENLQKIMKDIKVSTIEELYLSIGSLRYTPTYIIQLVHEDKKDVQDILFDRLKNKNSKEDYKNDVIVAGSKDILVTIAKCCKPIIGDQIIGYVTKGQGVSIHRYDCPNVQEETDRLLNVQWNKTANNYYFTDIYVEIASPKNYMLDIITIASQLNVHIEDFNKFTKKNTTIYEITLKIHNTKEIDSFINELNKQKYVIMASREQL